MRNGVFIANVCARISRIVSRGRCIWCVVRIILGLDIVFFIIVINKLLRSSRHGTVFGNRNVIYPQLYKVQ